MGDWLRCLGYHLQRSHHFLKSQDPLTNLKFLKIKKLLGVISLEYISISFK